MKSIVDRMYGAVPDEKRAEATFGVYTGGFFLSVMLTVAAYLLVTRTTVAGWGLVLALLGLALIQLMVQLLFFLHLDSEKRPRWNLMAFLFMCLIVLVLVVGSIWIMKHLDYHHMSPSETDSYILHDEGIR